MTAAAAASAAAAARALVPCGAEKHSCIPNAQWSSGDGALLASFCVAPRYVDPRLTTPPARPQSSLVSTSDMPSAGHVKAVKATAMEYLSSSRSKLKELYKQQMIDKASFGEIAKQICERLAQRLG